MPSLSFLLVVILPFPLNIEISETFEHWVDYSCPYSPSVVLETSFYVYKANWDALSHSMQAKQFFFSLLSLKQCLALQWFNSPKYCLANSKALCAFASVYVYIFSRSSIFCTQRKLKIVFLPSSSVMTLQMSNPRHKRVHHEQGTFGGIFKDNLVFQRD